MTAYMHDPVHVHDRVNAVQLHVQCLYNTSAYMVSVADTLLTAWPKVGSFGPKWAHFNYLKVFHWILSGCLHAGHGGIMTSNRKKEGKQEQRKKERKKARQKDRNKRHVTVIRVAWPKGLTLTSEAAMFGALAEEGDSVN